jgi:hypothetical protein
METIISTRKRLLAALLAFATFAVVLVGAGAASGQQQAKAIGGNVTVTGTLPIRVTYNWGNIWSNTRLIYPGERGSWWGDVDGFQSFTDRPTKCRISPTFIRTYAPGWYKITDIESLTCWR